MDTDKHGSKANSTRIPLIAMASESIRENSCNPCLNSSDSSVIYSFAVGTGSAGGRTQKRLHRNVDDSRESDGNKPGKMGGKFRAQIPAQRIIPDLSAAPSAVAGLYFRPVTSATAFWTISRSLVPRKPLKPTDNFVCLSMTIGCPPSQPMKSGRMMPYWCSSILPAYTRVSYSPVL